MAKHVHTVLAGALAVATAQRRLDIGPVAAPSQVVLDVHGLPFFAGQQVKDSVTGHLGEIIHGGVTNENTQNTGT